MAGRFRRAKEENRVELDSEVRSRQGAQLEWDIIAISMAFKDSELPSLNAFEEKEGYRLFPKRVVGFR